MLRVNNNSELSEIADDVCRLYFSTDCIILDNAIYSLNDKFESLFCLEKTMNKVKERAISEIATIDAFDDAEAFKTKAQAYKSARTFLTLNKERVDKIKDKDRRKNIAKMLGIKITSEDKFKLDDAGAVRLIKYLCFKIFKDYETEELLEGNNVTKLLMTRP